MTERKKFEVEIDYTFRVKVEVLAEDESEARSIVCNDCGFTKDLGFHTNNDDAVKDWDCNPHPDSEILNVTQTEFESSPSLY